MRMTMQEVGGWMYRMRFEGKMNGEWVVLSLPYVEIAKVYD